MKLTLHQVRGRRPPLPPKRLSAFRSEFDLIFVKSCPAASNSLKNPLTFDSVEERDRATCWKFAPDGFDRDLQTGHALDEANSLPTGKSAIYGAIALCLIASSSVWYLSFAEGQGEVLHPIPSGETAMLPLTSEVKNQEREAGNFERALKAVRAFSECETLQERAAFVVDPNRVSPLMAAFYERAPVAAINWSSLQVEGMIKHDGQVDYLVAGSRADGFSPEWITVSVKEGSTGNANSYQIDWEAFVGYCSSTWEEFKSNPPSEPEAFRVFAQLGNYYSEPISDPREWVCVELRDKAKNFQAYGYANRWSPLGRKLTSILWKRSNVPLTIEAHWPTAGHTSNQVVISSLKQRGWHASQPFQP